VGVEDILYQAVDVLAPCAMGAVLNQQVIPRIRAGIVAGAANNQLATINDGADLQGRGILYCPDFLINAGGIIDVHHQRMGSANVVKQEHILRISESLAEVLRRAAEAQVQTHLIAEALAMERLRSKLSETTTLAA
jgi:leucine dehydrogenase